MPNRNYPRYSGGSGLADLLSGLADGYKMGSALKSQRDADKLARDREARYVAEQAAAQKQRELENNWRLEDNQRRDMEGASKGIFRTTDGLDLDATVTTRDNTDVRQGLDGASRALASMPGFEAQAPLLQMNAAKVTDATAPRYQRVGAGVVDRTRTDPVLAQQLADEKARTERERSARALDLISPGAGQAIRGGASNDAGLRFADGQVERGTRTKEREAATAGALELARRFNVDPSNLTPEQVSGLVKTEMDVQSAGREARARAANTPVNYEFRTNPLTGETVAINPRNPKQVVPVFGGQTGINPDDPNFGFAANSYLKATESERKAAGWGVRAAPGVRLLQSMPMPSDLQLIVARSAGKSREDFSSSVVNWAKSQTLGSNGQRYLNALKTAGQGLLRKDTGAAVNDDELPLVLDMIGYRAGETKEARADKMAQMDNMLLEFATSGGKAMTSPFIREFAGEVRAILKPKSYVERRTAQLKTVGYSREEAVKKALEDAKLRFSAGEVQ